MHGAATSDDLLAERAASGDARAFEELVRRHRGPVTGLLRNEMTGWADVEDVAQEVFERAWTKLPSLRDPSLFRPWLLQIARRAVIDHHRRALRRPALANDDELVLAATSDDLPGPADLVELADLARSVRRGIDGLSRREATALSLAVHFGFGPDEIADALGITPGNAKVVVHRARKRLRSILNAEFEFPEVPA